jgi:hypothetical protein
MEQYPDSWRAEWLRLKGLAQWAEYYGQLEDAIVYEAEQREEVLCERA